MSDPPVTVIRATPAEEADIRRRVRGVDPASLGPDRVIATPAHAASLARMLSDPRVSDPIYDLPRPITEESVRAWIEGSAADQARGEAVLILSLDTGWLGRAIAVYGGIYIAASLGWLWLVEGRRPDTWDLLGAAICLVGAAVILFAPRGA